jgi:hypothetical protein
MRHFPSRFIRTHKSRIIHKAEGGAAGEKLVTAEDLLGGAFTFGAEPELGALLFRTLWAIDGINLGDMIDSFFGSASVTIDHYQFLRN